MIVNDLKNSVNLCFMMLDHYFNLQMELYNSNIV
jgi:hypothetical protein